MDFADIAQLQSFIDKISFWSENTATYLVPGNFKEQWRIQIWLLADIFAKKMRETWKIKCSSTRFYAASCSVRQENKSENPVMNKKEQLSQTKLN